MDRFSLFAVTLPQWIYASVQSSCVTLGVISLLMKRAPLLNKCVQQKDIPVESNGSYNIQYGNPIGEITKNAYKCFEFLNVDKTLPTIKSTLESGKPILICCSLSGETHWVAAYGYKNNCASKSDILVVDSVNLNKDVEYGTAKYQDGTTDLDLSESMRINLKNGSTYAIQSAWTINIRNN